MVNLSSSLPWELARNKWSSELNPIIANPIVNGSILQNITLVSGLNVINHKLGQNLLGYVVIMKSANVAIYDSQTKNQTPQLTLQLISSGPAVINLYVF